MPTKIVRGPGFIPKPTRIANFAITYKCNFKCATCNIGAEYIRDPKIAENELSLAEIEKFFGENKTMFKDVTFMQITGGEPFQRRDIVEIAAIIHRNLPHCKLWIPTNGYLTDVISRQVKAICGFFKNVGISISIYGTKKSHDAFTGVEGSFEKAVATLKALSLVGKDNPGLRLSLSLTLGPNNYKEITHVYGLARKNNVDFTFRPANISGIYYKISKVNIDSRDAINEVALLIDRIERDTGLKGLINPIRLSRLYYMEGVLKYLKNPHNRIMPCFAGSLSFFLDPKGNVYPCLMMGEKIGNIREQSFRDIWYSENAKRSREKVKSGNCPNCWVECETYGNIYKNPYRLLTFAVKKLIKKLFRGKTRSRTGT